ncbi:hypothetical protein O4H52_16435 [Sphingomonadaceae bacterium G21617-S1]|nr:hypothetical protein [Sphingomonadaceae bacterium G21617-S1]
MSMVVERETTLITSSIQASLAGTRVAGGTIGTTAATADSGASDGGSNRTSGSSAPTPSATGGTASTSTGGEADAGDVQDEGGDEESSDVAGTASGGAVTGPNVLIDMSRVGSSGAEVDTPIISSGNSSLWPGADGVGDPPATKP